MKIKVKYHTDILPLEMNDKGDWVDLRAAYDCCKILAAIIDACDECLANPSNINSHKPVNFKEK